MSEDTEKPCKLLFLGLPCDHCAEMVGEVGPELHCVRCQRQLISPSRYAKHQYSKSWIYQMPETFPVSRGVCAETGEEHCSCVLEAVCLGAHSARDSSTNQH